MATEKKAWSSPYKTKLWLFSFNSDTFCKKELELWDYIAGFGPKGSGDLNTQLSLKIHRSRRQVQRYLRNLENHLLIVIVPGWAELSGGSFRSQLRYRRITALPWPNKRTWMRESIRKSTEKVATKMSHYQRRLSKTKINQHRYGLLYTSPAPPEKSELSEASKGASFPQSPGGSTDGCSASQKRGLKLIRKRLIDERIHNGLSRIHAIRLTDIQLNKILVQRNSEVLKK